jgi:biotin carboxylase
MGGKRVLQRVLIANNGMAATKAILSMRQWAYMTLGDERAIEFVAMATRDDLNANAEFIRLADAYVEVPSGSNKNNYANVDLIVEIAENQKVDGKKQLIYAINRTGFFYVCSHINIFIYVYIYIYIYIYIYRIK